MINLDLENKKWHEFLDSVRDPHILTDTKLQRIILHVKASGDYVRMLLTLDHVLAVIDPKTLYIIRAYAGRSVFTREVLERLEKIGKVGQVGETLHTLLGKKDSELQEEVKNSFTYLGEDLLPDVKSYISFIADVIEDGRVLRGKFPQLFGDD